MRFVPVKSELQQGILALHNMRDLLVKSRTAQFINCAVFYEYGIDLPSGASKHCQARSLKRMGEPPRLFSKRCARRSISCMIVRDVSKLSSGSSKYTSGAMIDTDGYGLSLELAR